MRLAFVTPGDVRDRRANSGIPYYMAHALARYADIVPIEVQPALLRSFATRAARLRRRLRGKPYLADFSLLAALEQGARVGQALARVQADAAFAPFASAQVAFLRADIPLFYSSDTTFRLMRGYYPTFTGLSRASYWEGERLEHRAIARATGLIYPSAWATRSAIDDYGATPESVLVAPYGANLDSEPSRQRALIADRGTICTLCFVAVNWERKGGAIAVAALRALREARIPAELTIVGCEPPPGVDRSHIKVIPRIDKSDPMHRAALAEIYFGSYFSLLPTRADCSPIVCCEASAHGTPVIVADTGGVSGHVTHGVNGMLVPANSGPDAYADAIARLWQDREAYQALVATTRTAYEQRLNWDTWARAVIGRITASCSTRREK